MELPEVGVRNSQAASRFSLAHTAMPSPRVRLRVCTNRAVDSPNVLYGSVPMSCIGGRHARAGVEHHYELINPPPGSQVVSGTFSEDVLYEVRLVDDGWFASPAPYPS